MWRFGITRLKQRLLNEYLRFQGDFLPLFLSQKRVWEAVGEGALTSHKWSYSSYKRPYESVIGMITPINGVVTLLITGAGAHLVDFLCLRRVWIKRMETHDSCEWFVVCIVHFWGGIGTVDRRNPAPPMVKLFPMNCRVFIHLVWCSTFSHQQTVAIILTADSFVKW